jgi:hypothetical protein
MSSNRTGRFRRELPDRSLAARDGVAVERFWRPEGGFDDIQGLHRCSACHQLASQAGGPRPCLQQVHNTTPQSHRCEPESGPAAKRGGDDPDAERLALGLVDDRSVVRPDEEASVGNQRSALTDRGLPDGVAEDDGRDGRPGGSYTLADPCYTTTREPDPLDKAAGLTADPARHVLEHGSTALSSLSGVSTTATDSGPGVDKRLPFDDASVGGTVLDAAWWHGRNPPCGSGACQLGVRSPWPRS